jgi:hypothetical protein
LIRAIQPLEVEADGGTKQRPAIGVEEIDRDVLVIAIAGELIPGEFCQCTNHFGLRLPKIVEFGAIEVRLAVIAIGDVEIIPWHRSILAALKRATAP